MRLAFPLDKSSVLTLTCPSSSLSQVTLASGFLEMTAVPSLLISITGSVELSVYHLPTNGDDGETT